MKIIYLLLRRLRGIECESVYSFIILHKFFNSTLVLKATPFPVHRANFVFGKGVFIMRYALCVMRYAKLFFSIFKIPFLTTNFRVDIRFADEFQSIETSVKKISERMRII